MKSNTNTSELYYFYTIGCAYCKKVEPIVDQMNKSGYNILKLDLEEPENRQVMDELKEKFPFSCGTPFFIDPSTGNNVCGSRDKETLIRWAAGEKIPPLQQPVTPIPRIPLLDVLPEEEDKFIQEYTVWIEENSHLENLKTAQEMLATPRPKSQAPIPPNANFTPEQINEWKIKYTTWIEENSHLENIVPVDTVLQRIAARPGPSLEQRVGSIDAKLNRLMRHLGVQ
jgi:thiol-disulfide isomerase/thioredoxin